MSWPGENWDADQIEVGKQNIIVSEPHVEIESKPIKKQVRSTLDAIARSEPNMLGGRYASRAKTVKWEKDERGFFLIPCELKWDWTFETVEEAGERMDNARRS